MPDRVGMSSITSDSPAVRLSTRDLSSLLALANNLLDLRDDPLAAARLAIERLCDLTRASNGLIATVQPVEPFHVTPVYAHAAGQPGSITRTVIANGSLHLRSPRGTHGSSLNGFAALLDNPDPMLIKTIAQAHLQTPGTRQPTTRTLRQLVRGSARNFTTGRRPAGFSDAIYSVLPGETRAVPASVVLLHQCAASRSRWGDRDAAMVRLMHPEIARLTQRLLPASGHLPPPPRERQALRLLLRGLSEKQIAASLNVSAHTVHSYVKSLYRRHHVGSRGELMSLWVNKT